MNSTGISQEVLFIEWWLYGGYTVVIVSEGGPPGGGPPGGGPLGWGPPRYRANAYPPLQRAAPTRAPRYPPLPRAAAAAAPAAAAVQR
jgi:hypothetical protein